MSNEATLQLLGAQIKQMRLNKNLTQADLGEMAGLSRSAVSEMENKGLGTMSSFIHILRVLGKFEILNHFITEATVSPRQIARLRGKIRKRASSYKPDKKRNDVQW